MTTKPLTTQYTGKQLVIPRNFILARGQQQAVPCEPGADALASAEKTEIAANAAQSQDASAPVCLLFADERLAEYLDEGQNSSNAWALRRHLEKACCEGPCFHGGTITEINEAVDRVFEFAGERSSAVASSYLPHEPASMLPGKASAEVMQ
jgi:hypothetical protein